MFRSRSNELQRNRCVHDRLYNKNRRNSSATLFIRSSSSSSESDQDGSSSRSSKSTQPTDTSTFVGDFTKIYDSDGEVICEVNSSVYDQTSFEYSTAADNADCDEELEPSRESSLSDPQRYNKRQHEGLDQQEKLKMKRLNRRLDGFPPDYETPVQELPNPMDNYQSSSKNKGESYKNTNHVRDCSDIPPKKIDRSEKPKIPNIRLRKDSNASSSWSCSQSNSHTSTPVLHNMNHNPEEIRSLLKESLSDHRNQKASLLSLSAKPNYHKSDLPLKFDNENKKKRKFFSKKSSTASPKPNQLVPWTQRSQPHPQTPSGVRTAPKPIKLNRNTFKQDNQGSSHASSFKSSLVTKEWIHNGKRDGSRVQNYRSYKRRDKVKNRLLTHESTSLPNPKLPLMPTPMWHDNFKIPKLTYPKPAPIKLQVQIPLSCITDPQLKTKLGLKNEAHLIPMPIPYYNTPKKLLTVEGKIIPKLFIPDGAQNSTKSLGIEPIVKTTTVSKVKPAQIHSLVEKITTPTEFNLLNESDLSYSALKISPITDRGSETFSIFNPEFELTQPYGFSQSSFTESIADPVKYEGTDESEAYTDFDNKKMSIKVDQEETKVGEAQIHATVDLPEKSMSSEELKFNFPCLESNDINSKGVKREEIHIPKTEEAKENMKPQCVNKKRSEIEEGEITDD